EKKLKTAKETGFNVWHVNLSESVSFEEVKEKIFALNEDESVSGMIVQLPLSPHLNPWEIMGLIDSAKDVDGFSFLNQGRLFSGNPLFVPATPKGIISLIKSTKKLISGKHCVVVGRSVIVGKPVAQLLLAENGTVTMCHSKTKKLGNFTLQADILVVAAGKPRLVKGSMVKKSAVVIDVGVNSVKGKLVGDVDFESAKKRASFITPVPGGVGPMTIASLLENTIKACRLQFDGKKA
ncbi:MAG: bifunctional 5,10-methylenetetrahydrofolate dehydrogenase/5,10-methenyltetrahydrofolate cyclohydrolase, partial [Candidatus Diapherotrites archaeon]|nr:bifunctional 5,10-methylenetetrahydrofolate dehydrogenase/5,10-methenyltetrahydrofolate cyclohydrolase [Candidatus Diapherotrites archaeon]